MFRINRRVWDCVVFTLFRDDEMRDNPAVNTMTLMVPVMEHAANV